MGIDNFIEEYGLVGMDSSDLIGFIWWDCKEISQDEKLDLSFQLFERFPDYVVTSEWHMQFKILSVQNKEKLWDRYRYYLTSDKQPHREQIEYSIWVDFFEDINTSDETWQKIIVEKPNEKIIEVVLPNSGPVSFERKEELYKELLKDKKWHELILKSLVGSFFDVNGNLDFSKGRMIFEQLVVDCESEQYKIFKEYVYKYESKQEYWDDMNRKNTNRR